MRIVAFVEIYPVPFKPYYDAQFAALLDAGHDVTIFSYAAERDTLNEKVQRYGLEGRTRHYPTLLRNVPGALPGAAVNLLRRPRVTVRAVRAAMGAGGGFKRRLKDAVRAAVVADTDPGMILIHSSSTAIAFRWIREAFPGVPVAIYYHGGEVPNVSRLDDEAVEDGFRYAHAIFTNTRFSRDHAVARGAPADRMHILPVGFDLSDFPEPVGREYRQGGVLRLLSAGRMSEEKGFIYALRALRRLVESGHTAIHYSLTGRGYTRPELERYVQDHGLRPYVTFLGTISTGQLNREMAASDVLLLPSIEVGNWVENQAAAVQEAMLSKALVVVSRTGGVPECVAPELQRFVVDEKDVDGLVTALETIYAMEESEMAHLGDRGRAFVTERFDVRHLNRILVETTFREAGASVS